MSIASRPSGLGRVRAPDGRRRAAVGDELSRILAASSCCLRATRESTRTTSVPACSTSGSTAATRRRSRSRAAPTAASPGTRARAAATSTPWPTRARRSPRSCAARRRRSRRRAAARSRAPTTRWRAPTGRSTSPTTRTSCRGGSRPRAPIVVNDAIGAIRCGADDGVGCSFVCGTGTAIGARARRRPPLARQLAGRAVLHDRPHARDARRRGAQRARACCRRACLPERVAAAYGARDAAAVDGARHGPRAASAAHLARRPAARLRGRGRRAGARARRLGRARERRLPARRRARVRSRRADADHARGRRHAPPLAAARRRAGRRRCPGCELRRARREPAHGALLAALDEGGAGAVALDDAALPGDLFATGVARQPVDFRNAPVRPRYCHPVREQGAPPCSTCF